jgi:uncharacterized protein (TIGR02246 family)
MSVRRLIVCALVAAAYPNLDRNLAEAQDRKAPPKKPAVAKEKEAGQPAPPAEGQEKDAVAIHAVLDAFLRSYNAKDAKALGALFTEGAEIEDEAREVTRGRAAIVERFAGIFAEDFGGTLQVEIESLNFLGPTLAIEEGTATITPREGGTPEATRYSVVYVKQDGRWLHARIRDEAHPPIAPNERLKELAWMIGEWVNESDDAVVSTSCKYSEDGNFLIRAFDVKIEGKVALSGTQRIGWDPLQKQFRTWVFDTEGGFAEGLMARHGDQWIIKGTGVRSDGQPVSATNVITVLGKDRVGWAAIDRTIGGEVVPGIDQFVIVRKPPPPGK